jgi:hypothetical protein
MSPQQAGDRPQTTLALFQRNRSKADICTAIGHVRFTPKADMKASAELATTIAELGWFARTVAAPTR